MNRRQGLPRMGVLLKKGRERLVAIASGLGRLKLSRKNRRRLGARPAPARQLAESSSEADGAPPDEKKALTKLGVFFAWVAPLIAAGVAFAVPLIGVRAYEYVMTSDYFHVREVIVDQARTRPLHAPLAALTPRLSKEEVLAVAGISAGTHLLEADLEAMRQRLLAHPWVRWAEVERDLPDALIVHVVEHVPSAILAPHLEVDAGQPSAGEAVPTLLLVDELGEVFAECPPDLSLELPVITGIGVSRLEDKDDEALRGELAAALNVGRIWASQGLARRYPVGEIRLMPGGAYTLVVEVRDAANARLGVTEVVLGRGPFREKMLRVEFILEHLFAQGKTAEYVLLDAGDDDPRATEIAGARVVVKADLAVDPVEALEALVRREAVEPAAAPRPRAPSPPRQRPLAPSPEPAAPTPLDEAPPHDNPHAEESEAPSEAAPLTGGRPAEDFQEE